LSIRKADEVADRAIDGDKALLDCRESRAIAWEIRRARRTWQRGNLFQGGGALAVESMEELARAEEGSPRVSARAISS